MNLQRLNDIYLSHADISPADVEDLRQLTKDYPYFSKPFEILARHYHQTQHYKFSDMLRQAAIRVPDRKALYEFIHQLPPVQTIASSTEPTAETVSVALPSTTEEPIETSLEPVPEPVLDTRPSEIIETVTAEAFLTELDTTDAPNELLVDQSEPVLATIELVTEQPQEQTEEMAFEFEANFDLGTVDISTPIDDADLIGEEIAAEFTFSRTIIEVAEPTETIEKPTDSTDVNEVEPIIEAPIVEEKVVEKDHSIQVAETLRKHPVYNVEAFLKDIVTEPEKPAAIEVQNTQDKAAAKDFLSWLNSDFDDTDSASTEAVIESLPLETDNSEPEPIAVRSTKSLDIIEKFIAINPQISRPKKEFYSPENMAKRSEVVDLEIVSETLAQMYYEQGNLDLAIKAYEKLSLQNPAKQPLFVDLIEKIKKEKR
ncbi:MAG: hypothetical protein RLZZ318_979, partial [Bacteroidota bacterium]|jgi:tetratricopeptide (TPR) repeat protein